MELNYIELQHMTMRIINDSHESETTVSIAYNLEYNEDTREHSALVDCWINSPLHKKQSDKSCKTINLTICQDNLIEAYHMESLIKLLIKHPDLISEVRDLQQDMLPAGDILYELYRKHLNKGHR